SRSRRGPPSTRATAPQKPNGPMTQCRRIGELPRLGERRRSERPLGSERSAWSKPASKRFVSLGMKTQQWYNFIPARGGGENGTVQTIAEWLASLGLPEYAQRFAEHHVDASVLPDLTDQDLIELGVPLGHRRKLLRAIAELDEAPLAPAEAL